jgi:carbon-monoxide dehydrogenase medium subunit
MAAAAPLIADPIVRIRGTLVGSLCHADPQGDWAAVVLAGRLGDRARPGGPPRVPMASFVTGPFQNTLGPPRSRSRRSSRPPFGIRSGGYLKLERRVGDFATVGVAVALESGDDGVVRKAGIALTGVGGSTIAATEAAAV